MPGSQPGSGDGCNAGYLRDSAGSARNVVLLLGSLGGLVSQEVAGDERILAGGGAGQAEHQG